MAVNLKYIRMTDGDRTGITIETRHIVLCLISFGVWAVTSQWLPYWILLHGIVTCYLMFGDMLFCDAKLLSEGVLRLRGLTQTQAVKQASIMSYLKYQNPVISWWLSHVNYVEAQGIFVGVNTAILILFSAQSEFGVRCLLSTPIFVIFRAIPTHDCFLMNCIFLSIYFFQYSWEVAWVVLSFGIWAKIWTVGQPRTQAKQKEAILIYLKNRNNRFYREWRQWLPFILSLLVGFYPAYSVFWFASTMTILFLCRTSPKYITWFFPLVVLV